MPLPQLFTSPKRQRGYLLQLLPLLSTQHSGLRVCESIKGRVISPAFLTPRTRFSCGQNRFFHSLSVETVGTGLSDPTAIEGQVCPERSRSRPGVLHFGPPEKIRDLTARTLDVGKPGGRFVLGASNAVFREMPVGHYDTMIEVWREQAAY
jgi:hypothetical protein